MIQTVKRKCNLKIMSIVLAILTLFSCIPGVCFAANFGDTVGVKQDGWISGMYYDFTGYKTNITNGRYGQFISLKTNNGGQVYCVQLGTDFSSTSNGKPQESNPNFTSQQHKYAVAAMIYGYQGTAKYGKSADIEKAATNAVLWAIQLNSFNVDDEAFLKHAFVTSGGHMGNCSAANAAAAKEVYYKIKEQVLVHFTIPSFAVKDKDTAAGKNITLKWDGSKYAASVTDNNDVLANYNFSMNGVNFSKSGNTLNISTTQNLNKAVVSGKRVNSKYLNSISTPKIGYITQTTQITACQLTGLDDPVNAFFSLTTESRGSAKIVKQAEDGVIAGLKFKITGPGVDEILTTGADGTVTKSNLVPGEYTITEVDTPNQYVQPQSQTVTVKANETATVTFNNFLKRGSLQLIKTSEDGVVEGLRFRITGNGIDEIITTGEDGTITKTNLLPGEYTITEVDTPNKYVQPQSQTVTVEANKTATVTFNNVLKKGSLQIVKESEDGIVEGLKFQVKGMGIDKVFITDKNGTILTGNLLPGTYTITEVETPNKYVQPQSQTVTVEANKTATVTFDNVLKRGSLKVVKHSEDGFVEGIEFRLTGTSLSGEKVNVKAVTDKNGVATFNNLLISGDKPYVLEEVATKEQYIVPAKQNIAIEWNKVTETVVENKLIRGTVEGKKIDDDGFGVCGALIGLFKADETEFTEETALDTCLTNEIGVFVFEGIAFGDYVIREITPPAGFNLNDTVFPITIKDNKQVINVEIENTFITGSVQTTKVDKEYPENKLSGAIFEIFVDVDNNEEFNADIDKLVGEMAEIETGVYGMEGLRFNGYFLHEKTAPEGFIADNGYYYFKISTEGETVIVENEAGVGFTNKPIIGVFELTKTDVATGKPLPNAGFRIKDIDGNVVAEGYTDENGIAKFELRYGKYTYEEFDAPDGYQIDEKPFDFEITEDGKIVKATMTNTAIPVTGNDAPVWLYVTIIAVGLACIVFGAVVFAKKKKHK